MVLGGLEESRKEERDVGFAESPEVRRKLSFHRCKSRTWVYGRVRGPTRGRSQASRLHSCVVLSLGLHVLLPEW